MYIMTAFVIVCVITKISVHTKGGNGDHLTKFGPIYPFKQLL